MAWLPDGLSTVCGLRNALFHSMLGELILAGPYKADSVTLGAWSTNGSVEAYLDITLVYA